jgi:hypothetical protein
MKKDSEANFVDPILIIQNVAGVLESLEIRYFLTGSFASSLHGIPRATNDADLVVEMTEREIPLVFDHFRNEFYVSMDAIREAVIRQRSFNLIHLLTMFKIDIFVIQPKSLPEMERRQATALSDVADYELLMKPKNNTGHNLIFDFLKDIGCKNFVKLDHHVVMMLPDLALTPGNTKRTLTA